MLALEVEKEKGKENIRMRARGGIREILEKFQSGYIDRDVSKLDVFMEIFAEGVEVIGTNGSFPGKEEWYLNRAGARDLVKGDWEDWGDLRLNFDELKINVRDDIGWISIPATVTKYIGEENYQAYLDYVKDYIETSEASAKQKLHNILRGGTNTVFELNRGEKFVWPLRITAVLALEGECWKIHQMCFSFSTIYFPDVRLVAK